MTMRPDAPLLLDERSKSQRRKPEHDAMRIARSIAVQKTPEGRAANTKHSLAYARKKARDLMEPPELRAQPAAIDLIRRAAEQAKERGVTPGNFLLMLVAGETKLIDTRWEKGRLVEYERLPTPAERQKAAETLQPYYEEKKAESVQTAITIKHVLPQSALDAVELDEQGRVIDAEDIDFVDQDDADDQDSD